jgi:prevent-host-death family protein
MAITTFSSREFNQEPSRAKKAANEGPVFITDRGQPAHVLLSIADYNRLTGGTLTLLEAVAQTDTADFPFEPPRVGNLFKPAEFE